MGGAIESSSMAQAEQSSGVEGLRFLLSESATALVVADTNLGVASAGSCRKAAKPPS